MGHWQPWLQTQEFLSSTHYSIVGRTDCDHLKNSPNQTHQNQDSVLFQHRIRIIVTNNENTEMTKIDFVVVKKVNLYFNIYAFYLRHF